MQTYKKHGLKILYRDKSWDRSIIGAVFSGEYPVVSNGVVVDVGAHIGAFSVLSASRGNKVVAFEPCRANYAILEANIFENKSSVLAKRVGIGDGSPKKLYFFKENSGMTTIFPEKRDNLDIGYSSSEEIQTITLDEAIKGLKFVDLLKIDCEGAEYLFLPQFSGWDKIGQLALELHAGDQKEIISLIKKNFTEVVIKPSNARGCKIIWAKK